VAPEYVFQRPPQQRRHHARHLRVAHREVVLVVPRADERLADQRAVGVGELGHRHPDHPRGLEHPFLGQAGLHEQSHIASGLEVDLSCQLLPGICQGQAKGLKLALEEVEVDAGLASDLLVAVALSLPRQHPLDRQQHEPVLLDGPPQLLERDPLRRQLLEQGEPSLARLPVHALEQPFRLEVDLRHGGHSPRLDP
jgi:hypothetical protein